MKKVLVLGYFGYKTNQLDGQTIKTRSNYTLLKSKEGDDFKSVSCFDTQSFQKNKLNLLKVFRLISKVDVLYYIPARNNLKYIFPYIYILCNLCRVDIHLIVVGGWLDTFLIARPLHKWMLSKIKGIYPQTSDLTESLIAKYGYDNVLQLHNFRIIDFENNNKDKKEVNVVKLVFMARIHPKKGVKTIFELGKELKIENNKNVEVDIYGPIDSVYEDEFNELLTKSKLVKYKGVLQPNEIYKTLCDYDLMLFPTQYFTEGFPGSILDSYIAEVPVISTNWKFASEFITNNKSGIIVEFDNEEAFISETIDLINNKSKLEMLHEGAKEEKFKYSPEKAWEILKSNL